MNTAPNKYFGTGTQWIIKYGPIVIIYIARAQEDSSTAGHSYYATAPASETAIKCYQYNMSSWFAELNYSKHWVIEGRHKSSSLGFKPYEVMPLASILFIPHSTSTYPKLPKYFELPVSNRSFSSSPVTGRGTEDGRWILSINLIWGSHDGSLSRKYWYFLQHQFSFTWFSDYQNRILFLFSLTGNWPLPWFMMTTFSNRNYVIGKK